MTIHLELPDGRRVEIASNTALVGRDSSCQVTIDSPALQPLHARLRHMAGRWLIESQGDWPLQVGTAPPARMNWLKPGDEVLLAPGGPKLVFEPAPKSDPQPAASEGSSAATHEKPAAPSEKPSPAPPLLAGSTHRRSIPAALGAVAIVALLIILFWPKGEAPVALAPTGPKTVPPANSDDGKARSDNPKGEAPKGRVGLWPVDDPDDPAGNEPRDPPGNVPAEPKKSNDPAVVDPPEPQDPPSRQPDNDPPGEVRIFTGHTHYVSFVGFLPGDRLLLTGSYDKTLRLWSLDDGREVHRMTGHTGAVTTVAISGEGGRAVSGDLNGALKLWNLETRLEGKTFEASPSSVASLAYSPDGKGIVSGHLGAAYLWDASTGRRLETILEKSGFLGAVYGTRDDQVLVYAEDGKLERLSLGDHQSLESRAHPGSLGGAAVSRDGKRLATGCRDGFLRLCEMDAWASVIEVDHKAAVNAVAFSPDGKRVAVGGQDGAVAVYSAAGKPLVRFEGHSAAVRRVAFSSDGRLLASASSDNTARVWRMPWEDPARLLVFNGRRAIPQTDPTAVAKTPGKTPGKEDPLAALIPRPPDPGAHSPRPDPQPPRDPVAGVLEIPDQATQAAALKRIKELFKEEYAQRKPEGKRLLAAKLFEQGADPVNQPESRYVLLREARDLASEAADAETSWRAIDEMARWYKIPVTEMKLAALSAAVPQTRTPEDARVLTEMGLALMERAVAVDDYDTATSLISVTVAAGRKSQDAASVSRAQALGDDIREIKREHLRVKPALDALAAMAAGADAPPPEASLAAGKFLAFFKNDWPKGLRLLTQGSDEKLAKLASADLAEPAELAAQLELADGWWEMGDAHRGLARQRLHARAGRWYELALPTAGGLDKVRIEKRLASLAPPEKQDRPRGKGD